MNILMIGGTRFLGSRIVSHLAAQGHQIVLLNRGTRPPHKAATRAIKCDKNDRAAFARALNAQQWDAVIDTILSDEDLLFVIDQLNGKIGHFLHTGSIGVYGLASQIPATENIPLFEHQADFQFNGKLRQDQVLMRAHLEKGFPATSLRMSNIYGAGDIPLDGWGGRSPEFFRKLRDGETIPLAQGGSALLHPGHVADLARSFGQALKQPRSLGQIYNIAGPHALMTRDYVRLIARAIGVEAKLVFTSQQDIIERLPQHVNPRGLSFACQHMCCDITKASRQLAWRPAIRLDVGLAENIAWMRSEKII